MIDESPLSQPVDFIPDAFFAAIGKVNVNWGMLEGAVDIAIGKLAALDIRDKRWAILTAHMTWPLKMDILGSLAAELRASHPPLRRFDQIKSMLDRAQRGRNRIVHGQWGEEKGTIYKLRMTARGKLKSNMDPITVADIELISTEIRAAGTALLRLIVTK